MLEFLRNFLTPGQFIPHGHCYLWKPALVWLHIISDSLIALAYYSIPIALVYFVRKRQDLPFDWIFLLFGSFIVACGTNHIIEIWTLWHPIYWLSGFLKAITAFVSLYTAVELVPLIPLALALPSPTQLEAANQALLKEIVERQKVEVALQQQIKERQQAEVEIRLLLATTQAISRSQDFHSAIEAILRLVCKTIDWDFAEAWIPSDDATVLEYSRGWYASEPGLSKFGHKSLKVTFTPGVGLPGRVWSSKQFEWIEDFSVDQHQVFLRPKISENLGLRASFGVPILVNDQVLAVLVFFKKASSKEQPHLVELVNAVATQLGSLIQRKQTEETLRLAEQRYHSIVENAIDGIFQSTPYGRYLSANPALARMYGYDSPEELISSFQDISRQLYVDPNRRKEFIAEIEANNAVYGFEALVYRKDGSTIWIAENARAVRDSIGRLLYYEGTVYDITERKLAREALRFQQEQTEQLLLNILPASIAERLKQEQQDIIADSFSDVSVLFADLVGFTEFSSRKSPTELVKILNVIFTKFDQLAKRHGLDKIKTIGDAYMVVGGLPMPKSDHVEAIAAMALDMQAEMASFNAKLGEAFEIRIGIDTGSVVAGVIGTTKFIYDLWGDTVNVASRMESSGIPGEIQVTAATYERLRKQFILKERGRILIKGKGEMTTYLLQGRCQVTGKTEAVRSRSSLR